MTKLPLRQLINNCKNCPLHSQMATSPVSPEWKGNPKGGLMIILSQTITAEQDLTQEIVYGVNRAGLIKIVEEFTTDWYITNYMKCCPPESTNTYRASHIKACSQWIKEEYERLQPKLVIGFGKKSCGVINCDYQLSSLHNVLGNRKNIKDLQSILGDFYE